MTLCGQLLIPPWPAQHHCKTLFMDGRHEHPQIHSDGAPHVFVTYFEIAVCSMAIRCGAKLALCWALMRAVARIAFALVSLPRVCIN